VTFTELTSSISNALGNPDWVEGIQSVKRIMRAQLSELDPAAQIVDTHYFNHTLVPDFVIDWPKDTRAGTRDIFLRLVVEGYELEDDLTNLASEAPIIVGLEGLSDQARQPVDQSRNTGTMVTDPIAVAELQLTRENTSFARYLPTAVLKGGQGFVDGATAAELSTSTQAIFSGATAHERNLVVEGVDSMTPFLQTGTIRQMTNFARVLWEATGGVSTDFPISTDFSGIDNEGLSYLLAEASETDLRFWRAIGREIQLDRLLALATPGSRNLRTLLAANLDRFEARDLLVKGARSPSLNGRWSVSGNVLSFHGADFTAHLAQRGRDLVAFDEAPSLSVEEFRRRVRDHKVDEVAFSTDRDTEILVNSQTQDVSDDSVLELLNQDSATGVARAVVRFGGKAAILNFLTRRAHGRSNTLYSLEVLVGGALPMLWDLHETDQEEINELLRLLADALSAGGEVADAVPDVSKETPSLVTGGTGTAPPQSKGAVS
jgi:hypothetical protein